MPLVLKGQKYTPTPHIEVRRNDSAKPAMVLGIIGDVDSREYRLLLAKLLVVPVVALSFLALALAYSVRSMNRSAALVERTDLAISHADNLLKLILDQETGLRGYLLTGDEQFLQPYRMAETPIDAEFATLKSLIAANPNQLGRLEAVRAKYEDWESQAQTELRAKSLQPDLDRHMLGRKAAMDSIRASMADFIREEERLRSHRSIAAQRVSSLGLRGLMILTALAAFVVVWETRRLFLKVTGIFADQLAELRRQAEQIFQREQWLNTTLRSIGDAVIACDAHGRIALMNKVAEDLTGWREAEAKGKTLPEVFAIINEESRQTVENPVEKVIRLGTIVGLANHTVLLRKGGREVAIDDSAAPIRSQPGDLIGVVLVFRDISERRAAERAMVRAEKLASVGRMASAVAHEVNNPLEGLINLIYLARAEERMEHLKPLLDQADTEIKRIAHITRQTLGFYQDRSALIRFDAAALVREIAEFYRTLAARKGVAVEIETQARLEMLGSAGELRQALANIISNSLEACPVGGTIRVEARSMRNLRSPSTNGIRITVADTGCGIRNEDRERLFEPFFTTKNETGVGLGLWVARQLMEKRGGSVRIRSRAAGNATGTVVSLFLPQIPAVPQASASSTQQAASQLDS